MNVKRADRMILFGAATLLPLCSWASSHREAPSIAGQPRVDGTDFYMFRSYEPGRGNFVTLIANYLPLQDPTGGPNFFNLDPNAIYQINISNNGSANADLTFNFYFTNTYNNLAVNAGGVSTPVPLINIGPVTASGANLNVTQTYLITLKSHGQTSTLEQSNGSAVFNKPVDNIGNKSIPDYAAYAASFISEVNIPGCSIPGRVFVGQRKEGFVVNVGEIFDLVNLNPAGARDAQPNALSHKNVTSIALELPISCVTQGSDPVIGGFTTSILQNPQTGVYTQVSRLGMPLVNELVIGLGDKDGFNASAPSNDSQYLHYVTNPSVPVILNTLFGNAALVPETPRNDLVAAYLTGVKGLNQPLKVTPSEMLRLNTATPATPVASQNDLGVLGNDLAGFPNGRRPYDDVVDITLRVAEGALCGAIGNCGAQKADPNHGTPYTDGSRAAGPDAAHVVVTGAINAADTYMDTFPYLMTPIPGSPNGANGLP